MPYGTQIAIRKSSAWLNEESGFSGGVELTVAGAVEEALPLMPVEHQHPLFRIACHPHENPVAVSGGRGAGERDLDRTVASAGALPDQRGEVDAELGERRLGGHGYRAGHGLRATPQ